MRPSGERRHSGENSTTDVSVSLTSTIDGGPAGSPDAENRASRKLHDIDVIGLVAPATRPVARAGVALEQRDVVTAAAEAEDDDVSGLRCLNDLAPRLPRQGPKEFARVVGSEDWPDARLGHAVGDRETTHSKYSSWITELQYSDISGYSDEMKRSQSQ